MLLYGFMCVILILLWEYTVDKKRYHVHLISITSCKTIITLLLTHWIYCSLTLTHRYEALSIQRQFRPQHTDNVPFLTTIYERTSHKTYPSFRVAFMMTSPNGRIFCVAGPLCEGFTGHRWIPRTKASEVELWCFIWSALWINGWVNNRVTGDLGRNRAHCDVTVMFRFCHYCRSSGIHEDLEVNLFDQGVTNQYLTMQIPAVCIPFGI